MSSAAPQIFVSLADRTQQLLVVVNRSIVDFADTEAGFREALARHGIKTASLALISPDSLFAQVSADTSATLSTAAGIARHVRSLGGDIEAVTACSATNGQPATAAPVLLAGTTALALEAASQRLNATGTAAARVALALPAHLGAVVTALADSPASPAVVVWDLSENHSTLSVVDASGIQSVVRTDIGYTILFQAVQSALGLKFKAAASKLFFNDNYDFTETSAAIAAEFSPGLLAALGPAASTARALHINGLPPGQGWLAQAVATSLSLSLWAPDTAAVCARLGLTSPSAPLPATALPLVLAAGSSGAWTPDWLNENAAPAAPVTPAPIAAPAPAPVPAAVTPAPASVPVNTSKAPTPNPTPTPAAKPAPKPAAKPAPKTAPKVVPASAVAAAPAAPAKPATKPTAAAVRPPNKKSLLMPALVGGFALLLAGGGIWFFTRSEKPSTASKPSPTPASSWVSGTPATTTTAVPVASNALQAEVQRDPVGFKNPHYAFSISPKGVLVNLKTSSAKASLIENLGFIRLYGVVSAADGKKTAYRAGGWQDQDYTANIRKLVRGDAVVFDITILHPKFQLVQSITCLAKSIQVNSRFLPRGLADDRTKLDAVYSIHINPALLVPGNRPPAVSAGKLIYEKLDHTPLTITYTDTFKGPGDKPVIGDPALASFVLATAADQATRSLDYEIALP